MAAGDAQRRPGDEHARAEDLAVIDGIAQRDVGVAFRADVTDGGETGEQRLLRVLGAGQRLAGHRDAERGVAGVSRIGRQVIVDVDQARQAEAG